MHLHATTCIRLGFTREYIVPNEPYSQPRLWEKADFLSSSLSPPFAIFATAGATFTCNTNQNKEELALDSVLNSLHLLSHLFTPLKKEYETTQQVVPCQRVLHPWHKTGICHLFSCPCLSTLTWTMRAENVWPSIKEKCFNIKRKVILPSLKIYSGR